MPEDESAQQNGNRPQDPIADKSLSGLILVFSVVLFLTLVWAVADELFIERPWKSYQQRFIKAYSSYLHKLGPQQATIEKAVFASAEYRKIDEQMQAAEKAAAPRLAAVARELENVRAQLAAIKDPFQDARAKVAALTYELDHTASASGKSSRKAAIQSIYSSTSQVYIPQPDGGKPTQQKLSFADIEKRFTELKAREAQLVAQQNDLSAEARALRRKRAQYTSDNMSGLSQQQIDGLLRKMDTFRIEIKQIHVAEAGLVDRCESCHLGTREPLVLTAADMGGNRAFVSHPNKALMSIHDPERFGCPPCHNGNGEATSSVEKAHGETEHWMWPLFPAQNAEAGCVQCHSGDRVLEYAPVLTRGRDLFQVKGCMGCHRHETFDRESDALMGVRKDVQNLIARQKDMR